MNFDPIENHYTSKDYRIEPKTSAFTVELHELCWSAITRAGQRGRHMTVQSGCSSETFYGRWALFQRNDQELEAWGEHYNRLCVIVDGTGVHICTSIQYLSSCGWRFCRSLLISEAIRIAAIAASSAALCHEKWIFKRGCWNSGLRVAENRSSEGKAGGRRMRKTSGWTVDLCFFVHAHL